MDKVFFFRTDGGRIVLLPEHQAAMIGMEKRNRLEYLGMLETNDPKVMASFEVSNYTQDDKQKTPEEIREEYKTIEARVREMNLPKVMPQGRPRKVEYKL